MGRYTRAMLALLTTILLGSGRSSGDTSSGQSHVRSRPYIPKVVTGGATIGVALVLAAMLVGVIALEHPAQGASTRARTADEFVQSIGVVTHIKHFSTRYGDYATVKSYLSELGIKHARDSAAPPKNSATYSRYSDLCSTLGVRYTLNVSDEVWSRPPTASEIDQIVTKGGCAVEAFEGPNEFNLGRTGDWGALLESFQRGTFNAINASSYPGIPLLAAPLGKTSDGYPTLSQIPNLAAESDANNMHSYPQGNYPTGAHPSYPSGYSFLFDRDISMANYVGAPGRDIYATETGYHTSTTNQGVSEQAHSYYAPRLSFEYFNAGVKRGYHYQLLDPQDNGPTDPQSRFGLVSYEGRKKPAFKALENTIDILEDPGPSFTPGSLDYTLTGGDGNLHSTLLQKRDGAFYLALWQELRSYDRKTGTMINVPAQNVTLNLAQAHDVAVFDPTNIASSGPTDDAENHPTRVDNSILGTTISVRDQVTIVRISG